MAASQCCIFTQDDLWCECATPVERVEVATSWHAPMQPCGHAAAAAVQEDDGMLEPPSPRSILHGAGWQLNSSSGGEDLAEAQRIAATLTLLMQTAEQSSSPYPATPTMQTVHIKIPWCEPEDLDPGTLPRLKAHVEAAAGGRYQCLGCSVRRGCVELAVDLVRVDGAAARGAANGSNPNQQDAARTAGLAGVSGAGDEGDEVSLDMTSATSGNASHSVGEHVLDDLQPQDWVHWLYLQPPREAEVLVQACGRAFVTSWHAPSQQWTTRELPLGMGPDNRPLPPVLPKFSGCSPMCVTLPQLPDAAIDGLLTLAPDDADCAAAALHHASQAGAMTIRLWGPKLDRSEVRITARFHGRYLPLEVVETAGAHSSATTQQGAAQSRPPPLQPGQAVASASGGDMCTMTVAVTGLDQPGLLLVECWFGNLLTSRKQLVVLGDCQVAAEIEHHYNLAAGAGSSAGTSAHQSSGDTLTDEAEEEQSALVQAQMMQQQGHGGDRSADDLMTDLGCWVEFMAAMRQTQAMLAPTLRQRLSEIGGGGSTPSAASAAGAAHPADKARTHSICSSNQTGDQGGVRTPSSMSGHHAEPSMHTARNSLNMVSNSGTDASPSSRPLFSPPNLSTQLLHACAHPGYQAQMQEVGVQLLEHSCSCAWHATAAMLLSDLLALGVPFSALKSSSGTGGMTLLHRAVCSGSQRMVQEVVRWGNEHGDPWNWSEADPVNGITPLHVAAVVPSGGLLTAEAVAALSELASASASAAQHAQAGGQAAGRKTQGTLADWILQEYEAAWQFWHGAADATGSTPADIAEAHAGAFGGVQGMAACTVASEGFLAAFAASTALSPLMSMSQDAILEEPGELGDVGLMQPCSLGSHGGLPGAGESGFGSELTTVVATFASQEGMLFMPQPTSAAAAAAAAASTPMSLFAQDLDQGRVRGGLGLGLGPPGQRPASAVSSLDGSATVHARLQQPGVADAAPKAWEGKASLDGPPSVLAVATAPGAAAGPYTKLASSDAAEAQGVTLGASLEALAMSLESSSGNPEALQAAAAAAAAAAGAARGSVTSPASGHLPPDAVVIDELVATFSDIDFSMQLAAARASQPASTASTPGLRAAVSRSTGTAVATAAYNHMGVDSAGIVAGAAGLMLAQQQQQEEAFRFITGSETTFRQGASPTVGAQQGLGAASQGGSDDSAATAVMGPPTLPAMLPALRTLAAVVRATLLFFPSRRSEAHYCAWLATHNASLARKLPWLVALLMGSVVLAELCVQGLALGVRTCSPLLIYMAPWGALVLARRRLPTHHPLQAKLMGEHTWIMLVVWGVAVRSFMAAGLLPVPRALVWLLPSGGGLLLWLVPEVLMQVRLPNMLLPRCLTVLASTALYLRVGVAASPGHALALTALLNMGAIMTCAAIDLRNRCTYAFRGAAAAAQRHRL